MEERMKPEYDLYKFVQDRLDMQYEECTNENWKTFCLMLRLIVEA